MRAKKKNKRPLIMFTVICLSLLIIVAIIIFNQKSDLDNNATDRIMENNTIDEAENEIDANNLVNDITNILENEIIENAINTNNTNSTTNTSQATNTVVNTIPATSDEAKAINIAKQDFGNEGEYVFNYEGKDSNGKHMVCVRNRKTTQAITWYYIDIDTGTFVKE